MLVSKYVRILPLISSIVVTGMAHAMPPSKGEVVIRRDDYGIPHIYASSTYDLFYGYGHAVAQDRLYQMEIVRRTANGTVSEVLGGAFVATDIASRSAVDVASIGRQYAALSHEEKSMFEGYAAGFNARVREVLAEPGRLMPKEFIEAGFKPSLWSARDVVAVWVGLVLNRFFSSSMEVDNYRLHQALVAAHGKKNGERIYAQLRWVDDAHAPTILDGAALPSSVDVLDQLQLRPLSVAGAMQFASAQRERVGTDAAEGMPTASNAWVIGPARSATGSPIFQNGPQQGWFSPSIIYSVGLHGAGYDLVGSTPVALPAVFFGTNGTIAWGSTVGALDTNDVYQERLDPADPHRYFYKGHYLPMAHRIEKIRVLGKPDVQADVYSTVHGVVQAWDKTQGTAYSLRKSWQGHELETLLGWAEVGRAHDWGGFMHAASKIAASITWFYADTSGNIGAAALGRLPKRPPGQSVQFPTPGDGRLEWEGFEPFNRNPSELNPRSGYFASWNNKPIAGLRADGADFSFIDRVNEIHAAIAVKPTLTLRDAWQVDRAVATADLNARYFLSDLVAEVEKLPEGDTLRSLLPWLEHWDGKLVDTDRDGKYDAPAAVIMQQWLGAAITELFGRQIPAEFASHFLSTGYPTAYSSASAKPGYGVKLLWNALNPGKSGVRQTYDFSQGRTRSSLILDPLRVVQSQLTAAQGRDVSQWRREVVPMRFAETNALGVPWGSTSAPTELPQYLNRGSVSFQVSLVPGAVGMCSAAAPGQSAFIAPDGSRGRHATDQAGFFSSFSCKQDRLTEHDVAEHAESVQILKVGR